MSPRVFCVSTELWQEAAERLSERVRKLQETFKCKPEVDWADEDSMCVKMSPCTTQLWRKHVGIEHDEFTSYFKHWFKKVDGKLQCCKFSHLALMPLVRSCVWQSLLAEFVTGRLCGHDAVRLRMEDELEFHSNLSNKELRRKIAMETQVFFNLVKNHLGAKSRPLNRAGLGAAERLVINLPGLDYRNARRGWSNRKFRRELADRIVDAGIGNLETRREQEAFVWKFLGGNDSLKQSAASAIMKLLKNYYFEDTGELIIKPWSKEELSEIRREARERGCSERVAARVVEIQEKMNRGEALTGAERYFKCKHKQFFEESAVREQPPIRKESKIIQITASSLTPPDNKKSGKSKQKSQNLKSKSNNSSLSETYGEMSLKPTGETK